MHKILGLALLLLAPALAAQTWTAATNSAQWSARYALTSAAYDNKLWVIGGNAGGRTNDVWSSTDGATWTQVTAAAQFPARYNHCALVFDNKMWVLGGNSATATYSNDVWYSTDGITWTQATAAAQWPGRELFAVEVFAGKMWVLGGRTGTMFNDVWSSSDGVTWTQATAAASWTPRRSLTTEVHNGKIWVLGSNADRDVWSSTDGATWTLVTNTPAWLAHFGHTSAFYNGKFWMLSGGGTNEVWSSPDGVTWTLQTPAPGWGARSYHTTEVFAGKLWIIGGYSGFNDVWWYQETIPDMGVERNATPIADGGSDSLTNVSTAGQLFTYTILNTGTGALDLTGTPLVNVTPGTGAPTVNVTVLPVSPVAATTGTTTFEIEVIPGVGPFDFTISIANSDGTKNPYDFTVDGTGFNPNMQAEANLAAGSAFAGSTNGPFTISVDPGAALANAEIEVTDPESDNIEITAVTPGVTPPTGITPPSIGIVPHPALLAWTGTADASNAPGTYTWDVEFKDVVNGTPISITISITINDLPPTHGIANAAGGAGSSVNPYTQGFVHGDTGANAVDMAELSDPNTSQPLSLGTITPDVGNPSGGAGFVISLSAGTFVTVAPAGTLQTADLGTHTFEVAFTDGTSTATLFVELEVIGIAPTFTTTPVITATPGTPYLYTAAATGIPAPTLSAGTLPTWLTFNPATGELAGTPPNTAAKNTYTITLTATNGVSPNGTQTFDIEVGRAPGATKSEGDSSGCAAGGPSPVWLLALLAPLALGVRRRFARRAS